MYCQAPYLQPVTRLYTYCTKLMPEYHAGPHDEQQSFCCSCCRKRIVESRPWQSVKGAVLYHHIGTNKLLRLLSHLTSHPATNISRDAPGIQPAQLATYFVMPMLWGQCGLQGMYSGVGLLRHEQRKPDIPAQMPDVA